MSQENVAIVREAFDVYSRDDLEASLDRISPEFEFRPSGLFMDTNRVHRGREGWTEFWHTFRAAWDSITISVERLGDVPAVLENFHSNVEWHAAEGLPWGGVHSGPNAVAENVFGAVMAEVDGFAVNVDRLIEGEDDVVVALGRYSGTGRRGGKPLDAAFAHVWDLMTGS